MALDRPYRRLPLRDLMTDAEKRARDLADHFQVTFIARANDLRDLSRPHRRKSHYPTFQALLNSLKKVQAAHDETEQMLEYLLYQLEEIRDHARREKISRG